MAIHNERGIAGELLAADHLQSEGYAILCRNWRFGHKELDIVARKDGVLVVVEVKTRKDTAFGQPEEAITNRKIRHIVCSADAYVTQNAIDLPVRFDLITIVTEGNGTCKLTHIEDAFRPPLY